MAINLTRFYYDYDARYQTALSPNLAFEDIETIDADKFEEQLKKEDVNYLRIDF